MSACPSTGSLFSTPLITLDVPDADRLNGDLRAAIAQREKTQPGTQHSNMGGYQSSWEMDRWGGAPAIRLLAIGRNLANRMTSDREGNVGRGPHPDHFAVTWVCNMWANVNRSGHGNEFIRIPEHSGRPSTTSMIAAFPTILPWVASSNSWTLAARCR